MKYGLARFLLPGMSNLLFAVCKMSIFAKMTIRWPRKIGRVHMFSSFTNVGLLVTIDGVFELWHQEKFVYGYLTGGRDNYKNNCQARANRQ